MQYSCFGLLNRRGRRHAEDVESPLAFNINYSLIIVHDYILKNDYILNYEGRTSSDQFMIVVYRVLPRPQHAKSGLQQRWLIKILIIDIKLFE